MGLLKARFTRHSYDLHSHPTYVIALITRGCERMRIDGRQHTAPSGSVVLVNPEATHDGEAGADGGWDYRTFYPSVELLEEVARELGHDGIPLFHNAVVDDPRLAAGLAAAHVSTEEEGAPNAEAFMLMALRRLIVEHSDTVTRADRLDRRGARRRFAVYRDLIDEEVDGELFLESLAQKAGVTRFQVIRDFLQVTGLTPGRFIRNRRIRFASQLIRSGVGLSEAAAAAGFVDQSHLSRVFRAIHGITPGMLQRAWRV